MVTDALRASAAHVVVADLDDLVLDANDAHHLGRVLRLRDGEIVSATDGAGRWRLGRWSAGRVEADGPIMTEDAPTPAVTIGFTTVKGDRPEWTVQKLTELGVDRIVVLRAARSVVRSDGAKLDAKLRRVAREACGQSRRSYLPVIEMSDTLSDGALAHFGGTPLSLDRPTVLVGPEGGWTDDELNGRDLVSLGPTVLRAETAAVAAAAVLTGLRG
jgi:16S rRNA (uracil1498-N3)-methyltransferase